MKRYLVGLALLPLVLWMASVFPELAAGDPGFWTWRRALVLLTGVLSLWWMGAGMVLALRNGELEQRLGGLDRLYRLHRRVGIGAGILVFAHWMAEWLPKKLGKLGFLPPRPRGFKGGQGPAWWVDLAKEVGEWTGYIVLALVIVALLRRVPYRAFRLVHKAFAPLFLAGTFHGLVLMPNSWWQQPLAWCTAAVAAAGAFAALRSLLGRIGEQRRHRARIEALRPAADGVLEVVLRPEAGWPGHHPGQFLLADFGHAREGAHPFTIASDWAAGDGSLTLAIKALGDYTSGLAQRLRVGDAVSLEGPYGRFTFGGEHDEAQVWVAGGIGITPFLSRLRAWRRAGRQTGRIDLFYSTRTAAAGDFPDELEALCRATGVRLHRWASDRQGVLPSSTIAAQLTPGASVWFCGPGGWGEALFAALRTQGLPGERCHRELFEFR